MPEQLSPLRDSLPSSHQVSKKPFLHWNWKWLGPLLQSVADKDQQHSILLLALEDSRIPVPEKDLPPFAEIHNSELEEIRNGSASQQHG